MNYPTDFMPTVSARYASLVAAGEIERDPAQQAAVDRLTALEAQLRGYTPAPKSSALGWLFGRKGAQPGSVKGVYFYGEVGRGKTMLMDLFFAANPVQRKRRAHFHEFMLDVHERVHTWRQQRKRGEVKGDDPIEPVAAALAKEAWLLCFDEFHVTDIADAMILGRLFTRLFDLGVVVVATSNVAPDDLYRDGLNRALFLPFVQLLHRQMDVIRLEARTDFRLEKLAGQPIWFTPIDKDADVALDMAWQRLTGTLSGKEKRLALKGRTIHVPQCALGVARFSFPQLCEQPLGAADYLRIAQEFHTLIIDHIPIMRYEQRNAAKRFITLIDALYDTAVKLVASAAAEPDELYTATEGIESMEFKRTASRLIEMRSDSYLALPHGNHRSGPGASTEGVVET